MSQIVTLVSGALRYKLTREGVGSLSAVEWHLLHVSQFIDSIERERLQLLLADTPLAELAWLAEGLEAIGAPEPATAIRVAVADLNLANTPGEGSRRSVVLVEITARLRTAVLAERGTIEQKLLDYAFRQPELTSETEALVVTPPA